MSAVRNLFAPLARIVDRLSALSWLLRRMVWRCRWSWLRIRVDAQARMVGSRVTVRVARGARLSPGLVVEVLPETRTRIEIGERTWLGEDSLLQLGGGSFVVGSDVILRRGFRAVIAGDLSIGDGCMFGWGVSLHCAERLTIGRNVGLSEYVVVVDSRHMRTPFTEPVFHHTTSSPTELDDGCWVAANAVVLAGVTVGSGTIIGANSVVSKDLPGGVFAAGAPAGAIRELEIEIDHPQ